MRRIGLTAFVAAILLLTGGRLPGREEIRTGAAVSGLASRHGGIRGWVTDETGRPPSAAVVLSNVRFGVFTLDGDFHIESLEPGTYRVRVEAYRYEPIERRVCVDPGRVTVLDAVLSPLAPETLPVLHRLADAECLCECRDPEDRFIPAEIPAEIAALPTQPLEAGEHRREWDGRDGADRAVASGIYFVRLHAAGRDEVRRIVRAGR